MSSPQLMSNADSDEVEEEVEESISSRNVEVDDAEVEDEMIAVIEEDPQQVEELSMEVEDPPQEVDSGIDSGLMADDTSLGKHNSGGSSNPSAAGEDEDDPYGEDEFEVSLKNTNNIPIFSPSTKKGLSCQSRQHTYNHPTYTP